MLTKNKKILILIDILLLIFAATFTYFKNNLNKLDMENTTVGDINTKKINNIYKLKGITISNISIYTDDEGSNFTAKLRNDSDTDLEIKYLIVRFYDKNKYLITEQHLLDSVTLSNNNTQYINLFKIDDLSNTTRIKFDIKYE